MQTTIIPLPAESSVSLSAADISKVHDFIAEHCLQRAGMQGCGKLGGRTHLAMQGHFLAGAMAALHIMGLDGNQSMPPKWVLGVLRGEVIKPGEG